LTWHRAAAKGAASAAPGLEDHPITAQLFLAAGAGETGTDAFLDDRTLDPANTPIIRRKASSASSQNRGLYT
jgi:hypothetical protein